MVGRHQPGFTVVAEGAITGATGCRVGCTVEPPPPSTLRVAGSTHAPFLLTPLACSQQYS